MDRRFDTQSVGDTAEQEAVRLLTERGWAVENLNDTRRNHPVHDLRATKDGRTILISVKHARAKREIRLSKLGVLERINDDDFIIIFLPKRKGEETNLSAVDYDVWVVPGHGRHVPIDSHVRYHGGDRVAALAAHSVMIKDKVDTPGGRSTSGAAFRDWESKFRHAWHLLPA